MLGRKFFKAIIQKVRLMVKKLKRKKSKLVIILIIVIVILVFIAFNNTALDDYKQCAKECRYDLHNCVYAAESIDDTHTCSDELEHCLSHCDE